MNFAATQDEARPGLAQIPIKALQAVMKPPARRSAHAAMARRIVIQHIDCDHRPFARSGGKGRLIGKSEILAQPDENGFGHCALVPGRSPSTTCPLGHKMSYQVAQSATHTSPPTTNDTSRVWWSGGEV